MSSAHKKVIVRRFVGDTVPGYLTLSHIVRAQSNPRVIDLLDLSGRILTLPLSEIKYICYVRDFNLNDPLNPERLTRRTFLARPRTEGLWLRLTFRGSSPNPATTTEADIFEGLAPIDLSLADDLIDDSGIFLIPPDIRSNTQRIYVPRTAIADLQLIAVITTPSRKKPLPRSTATPTLQEDLFHNLPPSARPN
ncbi:DUF6982 domain-containing protein [Edaphobacter flagellatus]|uniref:DUF6982 domain-containing protein n=1 Tax=Edaphobacter flagellatus TaxID=1933044 RepID=UPI0021B18E99|nr:hypothetical protein [Edaphobacter flagellatus]